MFTEDDVVACAATELRNRGFEILVECSNQSAAFRFALEQGRWKAPDLVAAGRGVVLVGEAKLIAADLVRRGQSGVSDVEALRRISSSPATVADILAEAKRRLLAMGAAGSSLEAVRPLVCALDGAWPELPSEFVAIAVDRATRVVRLRGLSSDPN